MRLVLLGDPVGHSRSPAIHGAALKAVGLEGTYRAREVNEAGFRAACRELRDGRLDGANVTMPHKALAARCSDALAGEAARLEVVNTLTRQGSSLVGHNTDVEGIRVAWEEAGFPADAPVLILGGGGAATAALAALEGREVAIATRRPGLGIAAARRIAVRCREVGWGVPVSGAVVVNATPMGLGGETLPAGIVEAASGLLDMVYGESEAPAVARARQLGIPAVDGLVMLVAQAARSFELWTGLPAPRGVMAASARL